MGEERASKVGDRSLLRLSPPPTQPIPVAGTYLDLDLRARALPDRAYVYSNFITSLDGRISISQGSDAPAGVPSELANPTDWRLFQELAAQADVIITSGRFVREHGSGASDAVFTAPGNPAMSDLASWRADQGLPPSPAVAVVSRSLEFTYPVAEGSQQPVLVFTGVDAPADRVAALHDAGADVLVAGDGRDVDGRALAVSLRERGFPIAFAPAGPYLLHTLVDGGVLDLLCVTLAHRLLGGENFATLLEGPHLETPRDMKLRLLAQDASAFGGAGQVFMAFEA